MAVADTDLLRKSRTRYLTLAGSAVAVGLWMVAWSGGRRDLPVSDLLPHFPVVRQALIFGAALPLLLLLCGCALYAAAQARKAALGDPAAAHTGWRMGRAVYALMAVTLLVLLAFGLFELLLSRRWRTGTLAGLLGAGVWGGWFLTVMRDQINLFGQAQADPPAPSADRSGS